MLLSSLDRAEICVRGEDVIVSIFGGRVEFWTVSRNNNNEPILERGNERIPFGQGIVGYVAETGNAVNIPDAYCDRRYDPSQDREKGLSTRSVLATPVMSRGSLIAVLMASNRVVGDDIVPFSHEDEGLLTLLSGHVAQGLENAAAHSRQVETEKDSHVLMHAMLAVAVQPDWKLCISAILQTAAQLLESPCASLFLRDEMGLLIKFLQLDGEEELRSEQVSP